MRRPPDRVVAANLYRVAEAAYWARETETTLAERMATLRVRCRAAAEAGASIKAVEEVADLPCEDWR